MNNNDDKIVTLADLQKDFERERRSKGETVIKPKNGGPTYFPHTLNNTVVAPPRMLIAFLENNYCEDGTVKIPAVLRPYMGGKELLRPSK